MLKSNDNGNMTRGRSGLVAGIMLLALGLRLYRVDQPLIDAFSWREASTAMMAHNFLHVRANIFFPEVSWTGPGPNYQGREFQTFSFVVAMLWRVFGQHEWIGRVVASMFGVLGVFSMYRLVRRIWDEPHALASALMLAILPGAIFIDRSFLPDPAMLGITLTGAWLSVRAMQTGRSLALATLVVALGFLTKLPGVVALPAIVYAATRANALRPSLSRRILALATITGFVAAYYSWAVHLGRSYPPYHIAGQGNWLSLAVLPEWLSRRYFLDATLGNLTYWLWTVPVFGLVFVGLLVRPPRTASLMGEEPVADSRWFFHAWFGGCVVLYIVGARELMQNLWNYHVFNAFAAAFAGHALVVIANAAPAGQPGPTRLASISRVAAVAVVTLGFYATYLQGFYDPRNKLDSLLMGQALNRWASEGDLVVTIADDVGDPISIYYSGRRGWVYPPAHRPDLWHAWSMFPPGSEQAIELFEDLRQSKARWLGIVSQPRDESPGPTNFWENQSAVVAHIEATCDAVERTPQYTIYKILDAEELAVRKEQRPIASREDSAYEDAISGDDPKADLEPDEVFQ